MKDEYVDRGMEPELLRTMVVALQIVCCRHRHSVSNDVKALNDCHLYTCRESIMIYVYQQDIPTWRKKWLIY